MFMLEEDSTAIMDKIFLSTSTEAKALLLRNICEFLVSQTQSGPIEENSEFIAYFCRERIGSLTLTAASADDVDMTLLIGNADNFADSGYVLAGFVVSDFAELFLLPVSPPQLFSDTYITSLKQLLLQPAASLYFVQH